MPPRPLPSPTRLTGLILTLLLLAVPLAIQGQGTDASIAGIVASQGGAPLPGAVVSIRNEATGFQASILSNASGQFTFSQLPLGGPYTVSSSFLGYRTQEEAGIQLTLGGRVRVDFRLSEQAVLLEGVTVEATQSATFERQGASTRFSQRQLENLPVADRRFQDLAALAPLVGSGVSIGGSRPISTDVRIDGVGGQMNNSGQTFAGPFTMTIEAVREFEIITNEYDVTKGRQGGGTINAVTKSGTNDLTGSIFTYHRNDRLTTEDFRGVLPAEFSLTQFGGSLGGPILKDRLHYFVAFDRQVEERPFFVMDLRSPEDEIDQQITVENLQRMERILTEKYGLPSGPQHFGEFTRAPASTNIFGRMDWQVGTNHRLTLRHNYTLQEDDQGVGADQARHFSESRGDVEIGSNGTLLSLRSTLSPSLLNELKVQHLTFSRQRIPNLNIPRAFVRVQSVLPNGTNGNVNVQFGGNRLAPEDYGERQLQLANTTYWRRGDVQFAFGTDNILTSIERYLSAEQGGLFEFNSLDDLEAMRPARYSRQVPIRSDAPRADFDILDASLFGQGEFPLSSRVRAMAGLRWDMTSFLTAAPLNDILLESLGIRNDYAPSDWSISPRVQLEWDVRGDGREVIRAGGGKFTSQPVYNTHVNHLLQSGLEAVEIIQVGSGVPIPDFNRYREDRGSIPGVPEGFDPRDVPSYINIISPDFKVPNTWKASASYQRNLGVVSLGTSLHYSRTTNNFQYYDRNMVDEPYFTIEGGRPVWVPASSIPVTSGRTNINESRISTRVGRVLELVGDTELEQRSMVFTGSWRLPRNALMDVSFTLNDTKDNSSYNCCIARTSVFTPNRGDPRDLSGSWGPSDNDFRYKATVSAVLPRVWGFQLSGRYIGQSGRPFSAVMGGDVNGDDITNNDLAFIFDPADPSTPAAVAQGMQAVLDNPDNYFRDYLQANLGQIASRNGGRNPWNDKIDIRIARDFGLLRGHRAELIADIYNFANLLNSDWGATLQTGNQALLTVRGFDPDTQRYTYQVNENFGTIREGGDPYQIQLGVRYWF